MINYSSVEQFMSAFSEMIIGTGAVNPEDPVTRDSLERAMTAFIEKVINGPYGDV